MYGEKIKQLRKDKKISQKELAELSGLSISYIQQIESGKKNNPSLEALTAIAEVLHVRIMQLLDDTMEEYVDEINFKQCVEWLRPILVNDIYTGEEDMLYNRTLSILEILKQVSKNPDIRLDFYYDVVQFLKYLSYRYGFDPESGEKLLPPKSKE